MVSAISTVPFIGTLAVKNEIAGRFKIVSTNIDGTILGDILSVAKVILIGEAHGNKDDQRGAIAVLNGFKARNVQLFLEGNAHIHALSLFSQVENKSLLTHARSWDLHQFGEALQNLYETKMLPLLSKGLVLLKASLVDFKRNPERSLARYRRLATDWLNALDEAIKAKETIRVDTFFPRNVQLTANIQNALASGIQKVIVIAGSAHITPSPQFQESVDHFTSAIENVPYVILNHTTSVEDEVNIIPLLLGAAKELEGALFPEDMTQEIIEEIYKALNSETLSSTQVQTLIYQLAVPIFGFQRCTNPVYID